VRPCSGAQFASQAGSLHHPPPALMTAELVPDVPARGKRTILGLHLTGRWAESRAGDAQARGSGRWPVEVVKAGLSAVARPVAQE
jgi:hypothetical protein